MSNKDIVSNDRSKETIRFFTDKGYRVFGKIIGTVSKKNPYREGSRKYKMWNEQSLINIPLLYLASIRLYEYANQLNIKHLLFVTRDCCHWHRIFSALFPDQGFKVTYFDSSRIMFQEAEAKKNKYYMRYIEEATGGDIEKSLYIDVHGTGVHALRFCQKQYKATPAIFLLTIGADTYKDMPKESYEQYKKGRLIGCSLGKKGSPVEMLNYENALGTLIDYNREGPVRIPLEYDAEVLNPYYKCVDFFLKVHGKTASYTLSSTNLDACINYVAKRIAKRSNQPVINKLITHIRKHEDDAKKYKKMQEKEKQENTEQKKPDKSNNTKDSNKSKVKNKIRIRQQHRKK